MSAAAKPRPVLDVADLAIAFGRAGDRKVVDGVSFSVGERETLALVGESGSGKSLTALGIMGLLPAGARIVGGSINFEGSDLATLDDAARRRLRGDRIGMIFQEPMTSLNPVLSIGRQMTEALEAHRSIGARAANERAEAMLEKVGIDHPARRMRQFPHEFSGGMRQRVMIAAAMALEPRLLIADEPTTALDVTVQAQILDLMREIAANVGSSLLLITHDMGVVAEMADRVVVLRQGRIAESAETRPLFANPTSAYTRRLLAAVPRIDGASRPALADTAKAGAPALELDGIRKVFRSGGWFGARGETVAVADVSLELAPGETLALVGESGSGKSTLGRIAARLVEPDAGRIAVSGRDLTHIHGRKLRRHRHAVQMVFQDPYASLDPRWTIGGTLTEPMIANHRVSSAEARAAARDLITRVGLGMEVLDRLPHEFSGGQRQRIAIARAMAARPEVIVADEPTSALDVSIQSQILDLMAELQRDRGVAFLFITHDLAVVRRIAHRVAVMRRGAIVELGSVDDVLGRPSHPYTAALLSAVPVPDPTRVRGRRLVCPDDAPAGPLKRVSAQHWVAS
jgi:ABC-type glutathione transport system ATPase component